MFMRQKLVLLLRGMIHYPRKKRHRLHMFHSTRASLTQVASYNLGCTKNTTQPASNTVGFKTVATDRNLQMKDDFDLNLESNNVDQKDDELDALTKFHEIKYSTEYLKSIRGDDADHFLKIIRCQGELNQQAVSNILRNYLFLHEKFKWLGDNKKKITASDEFSELLKAVQKFLQELSIYDIISAFCCCVTFELPSDHDLTVEIVTRLIDEIQDVPFRYAVLIYHNMIFKNYDFENELGLNFKEEFRQKIEESILKNADKFCVRDLIQAIHYVNIHFTSCKNGQEETLISLLDAAFDADNEIWRRRCFFRNCYFLIQRLNEEKKNYYQEKFFNKLYECLTLEEHTSSLCKFINIYAFQVFRGIEPYDAKLFDDILSTILASRTKVYHIKQIASALEILGHAKFYALERMKNMVLEQPHIVANSFVFFKSFVILLVDWNSRVGRHDWEETKTFIEYLLMLNDVSQWEKQDNIQCLRLMVSLASAKIFPEKALHFLSEKSAEINMKDKFVIPYLYVALNQAVTLMNPDYPKPFISEEIISSTVKLMLDRSGIPEKLKLFTENVKDVLESLIPGKNFILMNKFTKLGHKINLAVAVNRNGTFFNFSSANDVLYIEDVLLDPGYEFILILTLLENHYIRNLYALRSVANIRVKTLELLGYKTIYIFLDKWTYMTSVEKKRYIMEIIRKKRRRCFREHFS